MEREIEITISITESDEVCETKERKTKRKDKEQLLSEQEKKHLEKYIIGRAFMKRQVEKQMRAFSFMNFDGDYNEYLKEKRKRYQYKIDEYDQDIRQAQALIDGELFVGEIVWGIGT